MTGSPSRDTQRSKMYTAERVIHAAFKNGRAPDPKLASIEQCQAFVDKVTRSSWYVRHFGRHAVTVAHGGGRSAARARGSYRMEIPAWGRQRAVLLHELAHCVVTRRHPRAAWHGWEFAATFLQLVTHVMGKDVGAKLKASFKSNRVKFRAPRKTSDAARAAAGDRLRAMHAGRRAFPIAAAEPSKHADVHVALTRANWDSSYV